ncbi:MAG: sporulation protein YqfD [Eubacteriales bacterium]|nr:sporulation protein YqfD [Eubacteriales bacterium]MCI6971756.1 sporulation protein YqfD [Eubacterium sp.]MDY5355010.1 sporulation protein YqfD [Eubacteriales bacterium]
MGKIYEYLRGSYTVTARAESVCRALNVLMKNNVPFYGVKAEGGGLVGFCLEPDAFRKYVALTAEMTIEDERVTRRGLFAFASGYKMRIGFFIGAVLCAALLAASSFFVWDINVSGQTGLSEKEILKTLEGYGLYIGAYIPNIDTMRLENELVIDTEELSYASINLRGTVAEVVVRERKEKDVENISLPSNLVANCDGQIESIEVRGGMPTVKKGQIVKKGQLLVSGVIDSQAVGYRLVRARGEIYARISRSFTAEVPLVREKKSRTGEKKTRVTIRFFAKKINLFSNNDISFEKYDTIEEEKRLCLFDRVELPVFIIKTTYSEYVTETEKISEEQALSIAEKELAGQTEKTLSEAQILAREERTEINDGILTLYADIDCIADITSEIFIKTDGEK